MLKYHHDIKCPFLLFHEWMKLKWVRWDGGDYTALWSWFLYFWENHDDEINFCACGMEKKDIKIWKMSEIGLKCWPFWIILMKRVWWPAGSVNIGWIFFGYLNFDVELFVCHSHLWSQNCWSMQHISRAMIPKLLHYCEIFLITETSRIMIFN